MSVVNNSNLNFGHGGATHRRLFKRAVKCIDEPLSPIFDLKVMKKNLSWPDDFENQFIPSGKFKTAHYYDPEKPVKSLDAWDMIGRHMGKAFKAIKEEKFKKFNKEVARALHYVQDMSVPVHTKTNDILLTHGLYEVFVDKEPQMKNLIKTITPTPRQHKKTFFMDIIKENLLFDANKSRKLYYKVASKKTEDWTQVAKETLPDGLSSTFEFLTHLNRHVKKHFSVEK